jgi:hypothetical protein
MPSLIYRRQDRLTNAGTAGNGETVTNSQCEVTELKMNAFCKCPNPSPENLAEKNTQSHVVSANYY